MNDLQRLVLLEASVKEILRINLESEKDIQSIPIETALNGKLRQEWLQIIGRVKSLIKNP